MAVNSPGRNVQLTLLTATCPPKRMVRSRVSRVEVIRSSSQGVSCCRSPALPDRSDVMRGLDPRIHPLPECLLKWKTGWIAGSSPAMRDQKHRRCRTTSARKSALVADRNVHLLDLDLANRLVHRPRQVWIDLELEVIHALQRLIVLLAGGHLGLCRVDVHALHG